MREKKNDSVKKYNTTDVVGNIYMCKPSNNSKVS